MTVSKSYPAIHLGGLSNRILSEIGIMFSGTKTLFFLKQCFLTLGLGIREGFSEGSRCGNGCIILIHNM